MNLISSCNCLVNTFVTLWLKNFFWRTTDWEVGVNHKWIHLKCFFSHLAFDSRWTFLYHARVMGMMTSSMIWYVIWFYSLEGDDVGVLEFAQMFDLGLFDVSHFFHSHLLAVELAQKNGSLRPAAHPLQLRDLLERDLPRFWNTHTHARVISFINCPTDPHQRCTHPPDSACAL